MIWLSLLLACVTPQRVERSQTRTVLGAAYLSEGNPSDAIGTLEEATKLNPRNGDAWEKLALAYYAKNATDKAEHAFEKAIRLNPTKAEYRNNHGLMLLDQGHVDKAIEEFSLALTDLTYRNTALVLNNLGQAYYQNKDYETSVKTLTLAVNRAPNLCQARFNRAFSYQALNKPELALQDFEEVIELCGDVATGAYFHAAEVMLEMQDTVGACNNLRTVIREAGRNTLGRRAESLHNERCR